MRDRYVRLHRLEDKSGAGAPVRTAKDEWIMTNFAFLSTHVTHNVKQRPVNVIRPDRMAPAALRQASQPSQASQSQQSSRRRSPSAESVGGASPAHSPARSTASARGDGSPARSEQGEGIERIVPRGRDLLHVEAHSLCRLTEEMVHQLGPRLGRSKKATAFGEYVVESLCEMPTELRRRAEREIYGILQRFLDETRDLQESGVIPKPLSSQQGPASDQPGPSTELPTFTSSRPPNSMRLPSPRAARVVSSSPSNRSGVGSRSSTPTLEKPSPEYQANPPDWPAAPPHLAKDPHGVFESASVEWCKKNFPGALPPQYQYGQSQQRFPQQQYQQQQYAETQPAYQQTAQQYASGQPQYPAPPTQQQMPPPSNVNVPRSRSCPLPGDSMNVSGISFSSSFVERNQLSGVEHGGDLSFGQLSGVINNARNELEGRSEEFKTTAAQRSAARASSASATPTRSTASDTPDAQVVIKQETGIQSDAVITELQPASGDYSSGKPDEETQEEEDH